MRKYLASLVFVGCCAAAPLSAAPPTNETAAVDASTTVAVHQVRVPVTGRRDQAAMVREFVKWDYELRYGDQANDIVARAVSLATSDPAGPVYLSLPREPLAEVFAPDFRSRKSVAAQLGVVIADAKSGIGK